MTASRSITMVNLDSICVPAGRRKIDPVWAQTLADLMASPADCQAIEVVEAGEGFTLVYGGHRVAAARIKGWPAIPAEVRTKDELVDDAARVLREITENLARRELSVLDRAVDIARWREIYEATHLVAGRGRKKKLEPDEISLKFETNFSEAARKVLDIGRASIFRSLKIASIAADVRDRIALHAVADNQSELLALAAEPQERQVSIAALLTAEPAQAGNVAEAIALMDRAPKRDKEPIWPKVSEAFSRLPKSQQSAFYETHIDGFLAWYSERAKP